MDVILTLLIVAVLAFTIMKKSYPVMTLLSMGIIVLIGYTVIKQESVLGEAAGGSIYIDIFEYIRTTFISVFTSTGSVLMPVVGYAAYMNHIGASNLLAVKAIKPFEKVKNPYILCFAAVLIGGLLRLALPSQTGLIALMMVTIYPVMIGAGMSKVSAASACVCGSAFDWGPACPTTALVLTNSTQQDQASLFVSYQLPLVFLGLIAAAVLSIFVNKRGDKKSGYIKGSDTAEVKEAAKADLPLIYALFPVVPLVIMIVFSKAVIGTVVISALGAVILSFVIVAAAEIIRNRSLAKAFEGTKEMFKGMGTCYAEMITLISAATVFAGAVQMIGGFKTMSNFIIGSGLSGILLIAAVCAMVIFMTMVVASSVPSVTTFAPFISSIAEAGGFPRETVLVPFIFADGISRSFSPISAANVFTSKFVDIDPVLLIKRNAVPLVGGLLTTLIASIIVI